MQTAIPFIFMRGGTSRGPYFHAEDLPTDRETLSNVLRAAIGSGHPLNIDGLGGGASVTTKVAILSRSDCDGVDVEYLFAQVDPMREAVDFRPTCGNIMAGVGAAALEMGLVPVQRGETRLRIHAVNTGALVDTVVQTPDGQVCYDGTQTIAGVPGSAAPVTLGFTGIVGTATGAMLPTGKARDVIDGVAVTLIDVAMPMMILRAADIGLRGDESREEIDENTQLLARIESMRCKAGPMMGLGADVSGAVMPKVGLISAPVTGGALRARYLTPWTCHPSMAVTGAQCLSACAVLPGSVAEGLAVTPATGPAELLIEHPIGFLPVVLDFVRDSDGATIHSAGIVRTARMLARGHVMVPSAVWDGAR
ncbi:PrpF domain-containing protein [Roseinatronobacter alkalisoli]|uniref:PrpF domain-containing protein n=1 Tax=Roseinatronobacter alkalisoli TaxID=3028235 RepID=A0ABT5T3G0_9RHOB|nr:PrpF domain-containing protein [Roseinatronobacter sp. HJB301]MDD7969659.1 PrpF domain-containing protein [Roseinatronobacter sp. HJB301]